ncbi:hypothetical protein BSKO_07089 [Bryopsis sp. KO-2023]|nr:hypothetical protein BSKO_07089 [Bryopsis sp. KO-2023]
MPKSDELGRRLASLEDGVQKEQRSNFIEIGKLLTEILDKSLYAAKGYRSFVKYVDDDTVFKFTGKHAVRLVRTYRFIESLPVGVSVPTSERQVRPLIKLGFDEAREVWIEAQKEARREGKPVTGELVADLVGRFQRNSFGRAWTRSGKGGRGSPCLRSNPVGEENPASSFRTVLLMAEFEQLRAKIHGLTLWEKEKILNEWKRALDGDLSVLSSSEEGTVSPVSSRKRCQGELWAGSNNDSSSNNCDWSASDSSTGVADDLPGFARKKKRTGFRKPRSNMDTLLVHSLTERPVKKEQNLWNAVGAVCQPDLRYACRNGKRNSEQKNEEVSRQGLGLLWSAVQIVSK